MNNGTLTLLSIVAIALLAGCSSQDGNKIAADLKKDVTELERKASQPKTATVETIDWLQLVERNGQSYKVNSEIPFSGHVVATHTNGEKMMEANFKDGKQDGKTISWHSNGQKENEATYQAGNLDGIFTEWNEDGKKISESTFKDGQVIKEEWFDQ